MTDSALPLIAVLAPMIGAALILMTGNKRPNVREFWTILASVVQFIAVYGMIPQIIQGQTLRFTLVPLGHALALELFGTVIFAVATLFRIIFSLVKRNKR